VAGWDIPRQRFSKGGSAEFIFEDHANVSGIIMVAKNVAQHRSRGFTKQRRLEEETPVSSYPESANTIRLAQYHHLALYFRRDSADMTSNAKLIYMLAMKKIQFKKCLDIFGIAVWCPHREDFVPVVVSRPPTSVVHDSPVARK
jgi:hypothetical protein